MKAIKYIVLLIALTMLAGAAYAQAPSIIAQPPSQSSAVGGTIQFTVSATGGGTLVYQWRKNSTNLANGTFSGRATVSGATTTAMTLAGVTTNDQANYTCYITNSSGSITTAVASLDIIVAPAITTEPKSVVTNVGATVSFSVIASGTAPLSYQWYDNDSPISGATLNAYTISGVFTSDAGTYNVRVSNGAGSTTSSNAVLAVGNPPVLTLQPTSLIITEGQTASFSASASGDQPMYYFWRKNGTAISGATNTNYTIASALPSDAATYSFVASNPVGMAVSTGAVLTVYYPPAITVQPASQTVGVESNFTVSVTANGNPALAYQWRTNGTAIPGATDSSYTVTGAQTNNSGNYDVIVSNLVSSLTSIVAQVSVVYYPPTITCQPVGGNLLVGNSYSLNAPAGGTAPLSWQWLKNGAPIPGANSDSYVFGAAQLTDAGLYDVVVTNLVGSVTSSVVAIYVGYAPEITEEPESITNAFGGTAVFTCNATGPLPMNFQWLQDSSPLTGQTNLTLELTNLQLDNIGNYQMIAADAFGSITSYTANLHLSPGIVVQPTNQTVMPGSPAAFSVVAGGEPSLSYQWQLDGTNLIDNGIYSGSLSTALNLVVALSNTVGNYTLVISNSYGSITSSIATISFGFQAVSTFPYTGIIQPYIVPAGVTQLCLSVVGGNAASAAGPGGQGGLGGYANGIISVNESDVLLLSVGTSADGANGGVCSMQAYDGGDGSAAGGGAATIVVMPDGGSIICGGGGGGGNSDNGAPGGVGGSSILINFTNTQTVGGSGSGGGGGGAAGGSGGQPGDGYFQGAGGAGYAPGQGGSHINVNGYGYGSQGAGGAGGSLLPTNYLYGSYTWLFTNLPNAGQNGSITIVANPIPYVNQQPVSEAVVAGLSAQFNVAVLSPLPLSYQWFLNGVAIENATSPNLLLSAVTPQNAGNYFVVITNSSYACVTSAVATLTVNIPAYITSDPQSQTVLQGGNATFIVVATGDSPLTYQWYQQLNTATSGSSLNGETNADLNIIRANINESGNYFVVVTNDYGSVTSRVASLIVGLPPQRLNIAFSGWNGVQLQMTGTPNFAYVIQSATNLAWPIQWQSLVTNSADANGVWQFADTNTIGYPQRFYRTTTP
jgi:hypothetical protein